ncbi:hypothetical protein SAMN05660706_1232 [Desulfoscipio geothermicus DSM 3669]|uniref:Uncharacterized protein n=1 Tax=Desulfoscipio geothermicus DSM 3669 TaxID=1121426 RepID=A0A1I6E1S3_9FIRM|nr:hypothetical protein SAMN05660706_1232 [Desulfoscipio geothermicus DSM 3669]
MDEEASGDNTGAPVLSVIYLVFAVHTVTDILLVALCIVGAIITQGLATWLPMKFGLRLTMFIEQIKRSTSNRHKMVP